MSDLHELLPLMFKGTLVTIEIASFSIVLAILMASMATALRAAPFYLCGGSAMLT